MCGNSTAREKNVTHSQYTRVINNVYVLFKRLYSVNQLFKRPENTVYWGKDTRKKSIRSKKKSKFEKSESERWITYGVYESHSLRILRLVGIYIYIYTHL